MQTEYFFLILTFVCTFDSKIFFASDHKLVFFLVCFTCFAPEEEAGSIIYRSVCYAQAALAWYVTVDLL